MQKHKHFIVNAATSESPIPQILIEGYIGEWSDASFKDFRNLFLPIEKANKRVEVLINSAGGSVMEGFAIYDLLKNSSIIVDVHIIGMAASMAGVIAMAGDSVRMNKHGQFMIHRVKSWASGESDDLRTVADLVDSLEKQIKAIYVSKTGKTAAQIDEWFAAGQDKWFTAEDALKNSLINLVVDGPSVNNVAENSSEKDRWGAYNAVSTFPETQQLPEMNKQEIINMLAAKQVAHNLTVNSSDAEFAAFMGTLVDAKNASDKKVSDMEASAKAAKTAEAKAAVDGAIAAGKITEADREVFQNMYEGNPEGTKLALNKMAGRVDINAHIEGAKPENNGGDERASWTLRDWETKAPQDLENKMKADPKWYAAAFKAQYGTDYSA